MNRFEAEIGFADDDDSIDLDGLIQESPSSPFAVTLSPVSNLRRGRNDRERNDISLIIGGAMNIDGGANQEINQEEGDDEGGNGTITHPDDEVSFMHNAISTSGYAEQGFINDLNSALDDAIGPSIDHLFELRKDEEETKIKMERCKAN